MKDLLGREIAVGDPVACISVHGCCCRVTAARRVTRVDADRIMAAHNYHGYHPGENRFVPIERQEWFNRNVLILRP